MASMRIPKELHALFERDLARLRSELDAYDDDEAIWRVAKDIKNPTGNLILHICGNLQHYIGAVLDDTGYVRKRDLEFSDRTPRETLKRNIDETQKVVANFFSSVSESALSETYPADQFSPPMTTSQFLIHLYGHLHYHLGQVNYHRRLV